MLAVSKLRAAVYPEAGKLVRIGALVFCFTTMGLARRLVEID